MLVSIAMLVITVLVISFMVVYKVKYDTWTCQDDNMADVVYNSTTDVTMFDSETNF